MQILANQNLVQAGNYFMTKLGLKDAYMTVAMNPQSQKFHLERQSISIQSPSICLERSAFSVYQTVKTNRSISKKTWYSSYPIFRQYANYRLLCPCGDNAVYSDNHEPSHLSEVHYSQGEINNNSSSNHHLSGVHHQFYHKTNTSTPREGNENLDTLPSNFGSRDGIPSVACPTSRTTAVSPPSHLESSPAF